MRSTDLQTNLQETVVGMSPVIFSLIMRTVFFILCGIAVFIIFLVSGFDQPLKEAEKWWPFQAILANIITFFTLRYLVRKEGNTYSSLFNLKRGQMGKNLKQFAWLVVVGFVVGAIGLYGFSYLILGTVTPPELMFQPIPVWAAIVAVILFPVTNAIVETPTYIGYALPRLHAKTGSLWIAIVVAGLALALQHVALPLVIDAPYMLWRIASFIPLAIVLGFIYSRTKNLVPITMAHYVMDLQMVVIVLLYSI